MTNLSVGQRVLVSESHGTPVGISGTVVRDHSFWPGSYWVELDVRHKSCMYSTDNQVSVLAEDCVELP